MISRRFLHCHSGAVILIFSIALLPILGLAGAALDYSRVSNTKSELQNTLDAALLASAKLNTQDLTVIRPHVESILNAHVTSFPYTLDVLEFDASGNLRGTAYANVDLTVSKLIFKNSVKVNTETVVGRAVGSGETFEIVLVLDNTSSMYANGGINSLKTATNTFLNDLQTAQNAGVNVNIGLVTYTASVNVQGAGFNWNWMDQGGLADFHGVQFDESAGQVNIFDLYNQIPNVNWGGCVEHRAGGFHLSDTPPNIANPNTLFVPMMVPDGPDHWADQDHGYFTVNNYLPDDLPPANAAIAWNNSDLNLIRSAGKYNGTPMQPRAGSWRHGPNAICPSFPIIPLQSNINSVRNMVSSYFDQRATEGYGTNHLIGLSWGWRVLSPGEPYTQGAAYNDSKTKKILVFMSDGYISIGGAIADLTHMPQQSHYSAAGYLYEGRFPGNSVVARNQHFLDYIQTVCQNIKNTGIEIFTFTFKSANTNSEQEIKDCASKAENYSDTSNTKNLEDAYKKISDRISTSTSYRIIR